MGRGQTKWLRQEIEGWRKEGLISKEQADQLRTRYSAEAEKPSIDRALVIFGVLGAVLIGAGIISIFAYNWDNLARLTKALIGLVPLVLAGLLWLFSLWKKQDSMAWREGSAGFLALMVAAALALIGQTYHLPSTTESFLLTWMLLLLPLVLLSRSVLVILVYLVGIGFWVFETSPYDGHQTWFWALYAVPWLPAWRILTAKEGSMRRILVGWALALGLSIGALRVFEIENSLHLFLGYYALLALGMVKERAFLAPEEGFWFRPFGNLAFLAVGIAAFSLSVEGWIDPPDLKAWVTGDHYHPVGNGINLLIGLGSAAGLIFLAWRQIQVGQTVNYFVVLFPFAGLLVLPMAGSDNRLWIEGFFSLYVLAFGILYLVRGLRKDDLVTVNTGMTMIVLLLVLRFVDSSFSFLVKGLVFVLAGVSFLMVNLYLIRKKKSDAQLDS